MVKILHFADAHIDMAGQSGQREKETGLPVRAKDYLAALDKIVDAAIAEKVDIVLFAGDAYRDRTPAPTFQRAWEERIVRLSTAKIPTVLLVGNHDTTAVTGRAHTLHEFATLGVPYVRVVDKPNLLKPADLFGVQLQIAAFPWVYKSSIIARDDVAPENANATIEDRIAEIGQEMIQEADPEIPLVLLAHGSVAGATTGAEKSIMVGTEYMLPGSLVRNPRLSYVALGHIHKPQDLNEGQQPPVVYAGSIERVDFGEAQDEKSFVIAQVEPGKPTTYERRPLVGRAFIDRRVEITSREHFMEQTIAALPSKAKLEGAMVKLVIEFPRDMEKALDEGALRAHCAGALEFHLVKKYIEVSRARLGDGAEYAEMAHLDLLEVYWTTVNLNAEASKPLQELAKQVMDDVNGDGERKQENL
jgi:exonuclease SbcD